jgi:hypothetical protein
MPEVYGMKRVLGLLCAAAGASLLFSAEAWARQPGEAAGAAKVVEAPQQGVVLSTPELLVLRQGGIDSLSIKGESYDGFELDGAEARIIVHGGNGEEQVPPTPGGGLSRIAWEPAGDGTLYRLSFTAQPETSVTNLVSGSELRPGVQQVLTAFSYGETAARGRLSHSGGRIYDPQSEPGAYEMPGFPKVRYSDARVTLKAQNADFRQVLWLLSQIGNVSIMLDPYWQDEPTGSRRPPGAGVVAGGGGGGSDPGSGFGPAGGFDPSGLETGVGNLNFNFENVAFDTALDLIITSVGLVYVDIWPQE